MSGQPSASATGAEADSIASTKRRTVSASHSPRTVIDRPLALMTTAGAVGRAARHAA